MQADIMLLLVYLLFTFFCILDFDNVLGKRDKCISTCHRISTCIGLIIINFLFAPLDSKNRPLEGQERKCIRKRARIVVCLEWITGGLLLLVSPPAAYTVWSAIVWSGVGYIAWYLERKIEARDEKH